MSKLSKLETQCLDELDESLGLIKPKLSIIEKPTKIQRQSYHRKPHAIDWGFWFCVGTLGVTLLLVIIFAIYSIYNGEIEKENARKACKNYMITTKNQDIVEAYKTCLDYKTWTAFRE